MSIPAPGTAPTAAGTREALSPSTNKWADDWQEGDPSITLPWWSAWVLGDVLSPMAESLRMGADSSGCGTRPRACRQPPTRRASPGTVSVGRGAHSPP